MKKRYGLVFLLLLSVFTTSFGEILKDASGNSFITIGSTKDEVLEILGTPRAINSIVNWWYYGNDHISFDGADRVKDYTNSKALKILLLPTSQKIKCNKAFPNSDSSHSTNNSSTSLKTSFSHKPSTTSSSYNPISSGYGAISEKTGRAKTVSVKGYTRKDGTYVKPHYRSPPKRK